MTALERRQALEQQARLQTKRIVARARYSAPTVEEIVHEARAEDEYYARDPRWWWRWRWGLTALATLVWLLLAIPFVIPRVIGGIVLGFWYLAIGTMPHMAALRMGVDLLDD